MCIILPQRVVIVIRCLLPLLKLKNNLHGLVRIHISRPRFFNCQVSIRFIAIGYTHRGKGTTLFICPSRIKLQTSSNHCTAVLISSSSVSYQLFIIEPDGSVIGSCIRIIAVTDRCNRSILKLGTNLLYCIGNFAFSYIIATCVFRDFFYNIKAAKHQFPTI